jgi:Chaperone of endosialidase
VALFSNTTGSNNTACGRAALSNNTSGSHNTALGNETGDSVITANNVICIGDGVSGQNVGNSCYIGNIWNQSGGTQAVYVNSDGKLGAQVSSRRFKDDIRPMEQTSKVIYRLKPVSFRYKEEIEPTRPVGFGLIAEEVEEISPHLVTHGRDGQVNSVRYDAVNAMLLNEFLKEHGKVEQTEATIARRQEQIEVLAAGLQQVTARLEMKEPATKLAGVSQ